MPKPGDVKTFRIVAMNGGMNTVSEENSLISLDPNSKLGAAFVQARTEFRNIDNFRPANRGGQSKTHGFTLHYNTGSGTRIGGIYRYNKANGSSYFIYGQGGSAYNLAAGVSTDISGSMNALYPYYHFETALDKLVICNGGTAPKTWDGTSNALLGANATEQAAVLGLRQSLYTQNRLFGFSSTHDQSLLYYSNAADIQNGYSSNFVQCDVNDGERITCIGEFFIPGELTPVIVVGKERSVGIVTGDGTTDSPYTFIKIGHDVGIPGFGQYMQYGENAAFLTPRGIQSYLTAVKNVNLQQSMLTDKVYDQFNGMPATYLPNAFAWYDWKNRRLGFAVPTTTATVPNRIWYYDTIDGSMYKQTGFNLTSGFVDSDGTFYHGDDSGKIYRHDTSIHNYNSSPIQARMSTGFMDFFEPDIYKQFEYMTISIRGNGSYNFDVSTSLNYGASAGSSHQISIDTSENTWGSGTWGGGQWNASTLQSEKFFPKNIFKNVQLNFSQLGADQPVDILEIVMKVRYLAIS